VVNRQMDAYYLHLRFMATNKGTGKTTFKNETMALCQQCGNKWTV
jgi:hypothetical protein